MLRYESMWQDWVLAAVQWVFAIALIPTILHKTHKPALTSALLTSTCLVISTFTVASLGLTQAAIGNAVSTLAWFIILYQRWRLNRLEKTPH